MFQHIQVSQENKSQLKVQLYFLFRLTKDVLIDNYQHLHPYKNKLNQYSTKVPLLRQTNHMKRKIKPGYNIF